MGRKTRLWIGVTILAIIIINYGMFTLPLIKKRQAIMSKADAIWIRVKAPGRFQESDDEYVLEIFRKERIEIDRKIRNLNGIALTGAVIILSWTVFGLVVKRK
ncbi:MAG: hypothetical protein Q8N91_01500 [Candidatus Omnitrophota bacterium]|nr:hypothetical protein [Candidatus Omnitrophota bacterium]